MEGLDRDSLLRVLACCAARDVLAMACTCGQLARDLRDDDLWRELALRKWGPSVRQLAEVPPGGWAAWTKHRLCAASHPPSPLDLIQEHFTDCPFQHMVACVLCSRTTGGPVVRQAIQLFLLLYPTPSDVLAAGDDSLLAVMHPLGLGASRLAAVRSIAHGFLATDWQEPSQFHGCGKFVSDSYHIFCRGQRSAAGVEDKNLLRYLRWRQSGSTEDEVDEKRRQRAAATKPKREVPAKAGTLRSGRGEAAPPAGERRMTRVTCMAAADTQAGGKEGAGRVEAAGSKASNSSRRRRSLATT
ncbi:DNA glycosylase isoform A [Micractinium conductrix]|uniref:DNA glycosylase isoform A n=1 Tax=Micractinium conductrix TaxID=554055 RepID=A0A2P6VFC8_9CHLO|nr:DNA glycosylase isoform B [Micractinium conductrix]PSC72796.1 DNA glycosylase isoform A [Micractinium conductrix]|eukprot:PSC72795.1 DNA glycosylase isoform B [Micractinium conductrix]